MAKRLKILISAYACSPYKGSEPGVGWGFVHALSQRHDLWVIVEEEKFRADIERWQTEHPLDAKRIKFHFLRKNRNRWLRRLWPPTYYWFYRQWHREALLLAISLHLHVGFDLVHQLTMVGYREPGYLWGMRLPFVWGPVGGIGYFPWRFLRSVGVYGGVYYLGYNLYNWAQVRLLRRPMLAARQAGTGLVMATEENRTAALLHWGCDGRVLSEVGMPRASVTPALIREADTPLRIVWSGQHIPRKALNIGLLALAKLPSDLYWELHILGDGERTEIWKDLSVELGIEDRCHFQGLLPRAEALAVMQRAHVMLITSLRDLTATVTIEALALGLPIVCPDHCGFADAVTDACGIRVPVTGPAALTEGLAKAITLLGQDEALRIRLSTGAKKRAGDYEWDRKAEAMSHIYRAKLIEASESESL